jgi:predicted transcriptional regulator
MDTTIDDVIATMLYKNVHRLFIVDETNAPVGVVSYSDIIAELVSA